MASNLSDERTELQEDEQKLQTALQEFEEQWGSDGEEDEDEEGEEEQMLIDLDDYDASDLTETNHSESSSVIESLSQSQNNAAAVDNESGGAAPRPSLELPSQPSVVEQRADPHKTLALNRALQGILEGHIESITNALLENNEKQMKLEEDAANYTTEPARKTRTVGSFRAPYFRVDSSYPESNEDVALKKQSAEYDIMAVDSVKDLRSQKKSFRLMLRDAVVEDCLEKIMKPIVVKMEAQIEKRTEKVEEWEKLSSRLDTERHFLEDLKKKPDTQINIEKRKEMKKTIERIGKEKEEMSKEVDACNKEISKYERELGEKRNIPEQELLATLDPEKVDWMKIAKSHYGSQSTWVDCQKAWENIVSPQVNNGPWNKAESKKLQETVEQSETRDWKQIAAQVGNGRTTFQCFSHYQRQFNVDLHSRPWGSAEDERLIDMTGKVKDSMGFHSWSKVSALMDARSPAECMFRFTKIDPSQNHGRWSEVEDARLTAAVEMIGPAWAKVAKFVGTRNMIQCRDRYLNCLAPNINFSHFTYEEDAKLLKYHKEMGNTWSKMVKHFKGRTDSMLLARYRQLSKWKQQMEWFEKQTPGVRKMLLGKSLTVSDRQRLRTNVKNYLTIQLGVTGDDYTKRERDMDKGVDPDLIPPRPPRHLKLYTGATASKRKDAVAKWMGKLELHQRLTENIQKRLEEAEEKKKPKGNGPPRLPVEVAEEILAESVSETLENGVPRNTYGCKSKFGRMASALNRAFLTEGQVSVQDLLAAATPQRTKKPKKKKETMLDCQMKSLLRKKSRPCIRKGRMKRFFAKDERPLQEIEQELDELDHTVPLMLLKAFGTDIHSLYNSTHLRCLDLHKELLDLPSYKDDPTYKVELAEVEEAIKKVMAKKGVTEGYKNASVSSLRRKLKHVDKIFTEKYYVERKVLENKIINLQDDLDYMQSLMDEEKEAGLYDNLSLMACSPAGSIETQFGSEAEVEGTREASASSLLSSSISSSPLSSSSAAEALLALSTSVPATSSAATPSFTVETASSSPGTSAKDTVSLDSPSASVTQGLGKSPDDSVVLNKESADTHMETASSLPMTSAKDSVSLDSNSVTATQGLEKSPDDSVVLNEQSGDPHIDTNFAVPTAPAPRPQRKRKSTNSTEILEEKLAEKKLKLMTREEIAAERAKIPVEKKKIFTSLPFLPPTLNTLNCLRTLLLVRHKLINMAGKLYKKPAHHAKRGRPPKKIVDWSKREFGNNLSPNVEDGNSLENANSGVWFQPTSSENLLEQARQFQGFLISPEARRREEERRNQASMSSQKKTTGHGVELKPLILYDPTASEKQIQEPSSYRLVMGPVGLYRGDEGHCLGSSETLARDVTSDSQSTTQDVSENTATSSSDQRSSHEANENSGPMSTDQTASHASSETPVPASINQSSDHNVGETTSPTSNSQNASQADSENSTTSSNNQNSSQEVVENPVHSPTSNNQTSNHPVSENSARVSTTQSSSHTVDENSATASDSLSLTAGKSAITQYNNQTFNTSVDTNSVTSDNQAPNQSTNHDNTANIQHSSAKNSNTVPVKIVKVDQDGKRKTSSSMVISVGQRDVSSVNSAISTRNINSTSSANSNSENGNTFGNVSDIRDSDTAALLCSLAGQKSINNSAAVTTMGTEQNSASISNAYQNRKNDVGRSVTSVSSRHSEADTNNTEDSNSVIELSAQSEKEKRTTATSGPAPKRICSRFKNVEGINMPEKTVHKIMKRSKLRNQHDNVVLVGVDKESKRIVHFKKEDDKFTSYEAVPIEVAETPVDHALQSEERRANRLRQEAHERRMDIRMASIRKTDEYKLLLARFRSLFMWPVLLSTVEPSPLNDGTVPTQRYRYRKPQPPKSHRPGRKPRISQAMRERLNAMRTKSIKANRERRLRREALERQARIERGEEIEEEDGQNEEATLQDEKRREGKMDVEDKKGKNKAGSDRAGPSTSRDPGVDGGMETESSALPPKKRVGRPKGSLNKRFKSAEGDQPRRSSRIVPKVEEAEEPKVEEVEQPKKVLPQWWRDAVLAVMMSKKALAEEGTTEAPVKIEDDEDFKDKGDYSDDEWVHELHGKKDKPEKKKGKKKSDRY